MTRRAVSLFLVLVVAGVVAAATSALAHPSPSPSPAALAALSTERLDSDRPAPGPTVAWTAGGGVGYLGSDMMWAAVSVIALIAARRFRKSLAFTAALAMFVLIFESGVHSVHHLGDDRGASGCAVASASTHLAGTPAEPPPSLQIFHVLNGDRLSAFPQSITTGRAFRPDACRAPPR
jgi:hypothetical protein